MTISRIGFIAWICALVAGPGLALGASVTGYVSGAKQPGGVGFSIKYPDGTVKVIGGALNVADLAADKKRDRLVQLLNDNGLSASAAPDNGYTIAGLPEGTEVTFRPLDTKEEKDSLVSAATTGGSVRFAGWFNPYELLGQPAIFTAGIVTDVGELTATISAADLNFPTDGPIICQALFQRLAPRAPQFGAQINCAGDRLEIYFDPAYTVTQGGVIFGTTSPSAGLEGTLLVLPTPTAVGMGCVVLAGLVMARGRRVGR